MSDLKHQTQKCEVHRMTLNDILAQIENLSDREKQQVVQQVLGRSHGLNVVLGNTNHITNSVVIQLGDSEQIAEQLKGVSADDLSKILSAIAVRIAQEKSSL